MNAAHLAARNGEQAEGVAIPQILLNRRGQLGQVSQTDFISAGHTRLGQPAGLQAADRDQPVDEPPQAPGLELGALIGRHRLGLGICTAYPHLPEIGKPLATFIRRDALVGWALTQLFVWLGWLLFFYPAGVAVHMARQLFAL